MTPCPRLAELPAPSHGRTGWPWTEETRPIPASMPDGSPWPRVTVVTPSFNQAEFLEETIRSVLLQGYPNLEYIIIDGGSSDGSVEIISKYEKFLSYWVSEPDRGHCHAVNKGWQRATGDIVAYLNSDDLYLPDAVGASVAYLHEHSETDMVYAYANHIDETEEIFYRARSGPFDIGHLLESCYIVQPTVFMRRSLLDRIGLLDESLRYSLDYEFWLRAARHTTPGLLPRFTAVARYHRDAKSCSRFPEFFREEVKIFDALFADRAWPYRDAALQRRAYLPRLLYMAGTHSGFIAEERLEALRRLRALRPPPSAGELTSFIAFFDAHRDSPYLSGSPDAESGRTAPVPADCHGILPALVQAGIVGQARARRVHRRLMAHRAVRDIARGRSPFGRGREHVALLQAALTDVRVLTLRAWWLEIGRRTRLGKAPLAMAYSLRDRARSLRARASGRVLPGQKAMPEP